MFNLVIMGRVELMTDFQQWQLLHSKSRGKYSSQFGLAVICFTEDGKVLNTTVG